MTCFLLLDFGTTSTKAAAVDLDSGAFSHVRSFPSLPSCSDIPGRYEVSPAALTDRFNSICCLYYDELSEPFAGIVLCSEQNGFIALSEANQPLTNYISWKDERSLEPIGGLSTFSLLTRELGERFKEITGWRPGPGLPIMNVTHLARCGHLSGTCKIATLPEWLALCCGDSRNVVHETMIHCQGFYDVRNGRISEELTALVERVAGLRCIFNEPGDTGSVSGYWRGPDGKIPIYVGVGDHQCSVLGACNVPRESISLNLGTGSQVAVIDATAIRAEFEVRPYFDSRRLVAVTRIPAGRVLADYLRFLEDVCLVSDAPKPDFWRMFSAIEERDLQNATLEFDLAVFSSAWNYRGGGKIGNIVEGSLTLKNYLTSLFKCWVEQYPAVVRLFDPSRQASRCILSGGLARRLPTLAGIFAALSGYDTWPACPLDESLLGLRTIALVASGRTSSCLAGQEIFGRDCQFRSDD